MDYRIRLACKDDMAQVMGLIHELAMFENEPNEVVIGVADLEKDGFGDQPLFKAFVAECKGKVIGLALFYPRYSTWKGPTLHLEDLIVKESYRGNGIGTALYGAFIAYAKEQGVKRLDWNVLDWNDPAIAFYEKSGAIVRRDWDVVQMMEDDIKEYVLKNNVVK